ncbi:MAG: PorV/PorQ family protein [Chitinivibrionales bacterium]|nr:PorV/PorQ family protein [Chitinivibrionales bacterium]MBD3395051.1 PorV/PorQ family protein [Chitinivibrionales bacterium]
MPEARCRATHPCRIPSRRSAKFLCRSTASIIGARWTCAAIRDRGLRVSASMHSAARSCRSSRRAGRAVLWSVKMNFPSLTARRCSPFRISVDIRSHLGSSGVFLRGRSCGRGCLHPRRTRTGQSGGPGGMSGRGALYVSWRGLTGARARSAVWCTGRAKAGSGAFRWRDLNGGWRPKSGSKPTKAIILFCGTTGFSSTRSRVSYHGRRVAYSMKHAKAFCAVVALVCASVFAQHERAGTAAFPFLNLGVDARAMALGDVHVGLPNDLYGGLGNPAAIAFPSRMQAMLAYRPVMIDVRAGALGFSRPISNKGTFSVQLMYVSYGLIEGLDEEGRETNVSWSPYSLAGGVSWARVMFPDLALGLTVKGIYDNLDHGNTADGVAADLGLQYRMLSSRLVYGVLLRNMGFIRRWYDEDADHDYALPFAAVAGVSYLPRSLPSLRMALDLEKSVDDYLNYKAGLEVALYKQYLFARMGYRFSHRDLREAFHILRSESDDTYQKTNWTSLTLGVGVDAPVSTTDVRVDAALILHTEGLPPTPAFSAVVGF